MYNIVTVESLLNTANFPVLHVRYQIAQYFIIFDSF
jgi:hypothetical protein